MFRRGDFVTCTEIERYARTDKNIPCVVIRDQELGEIKVRCLDEDIAMDFIVRSDYFKGIVIGEYRDKIKLQTFKNYATTYPSATSYLPWVEETEMETRIKMDKTIKYPWSNEEVEKISEQIRETVDKFEISEGIEYPYLSAADQFVRLSNDQKGWFESIISKHPDYSREDHAIIQTKIYNRGISEETLKEFGDYLRKLFSKWTIKNFEFEPPFDNNSYFNQEDEFNLVNDIVYYMEAFPDRTKILYDGKSYDDYKEILTHKGKIIDLWRYIKNDQTIYDNYIRIEGAKFYSQSLVPFTNWIKSKQDNRIDEDDAILINEIYGFYDFARAVPGQTVTKVVRKICEYFEFTNHHDYKEIEWTDSNTGELKKKQKDFGWNYQFTKYCDAINPIEKKMKTVISVNPIDFLTCSLGKGWSSCFTIDKTNLRGQDSSHNYQGEYSGGTTDYASDESTVIMFTVDVKDEDIHKADKIKRNFFHVGEDAVIQSRTYPDGRDGSDFPNMSEELGKYFTEALTICLELKENWERNQHYRYDDKIDIVRNGELHYPDYCNYGDIYNLTNQSLNAKERNYKKIVVGNRNVPCLCCGDVNHYGRAIICEDCAEEEPFAICERCGCRIDEYDDDHICAYDGNYFCCDDCANEAGYRYCEDTGMYSDDYFIDDLTEDCYTYGHEHYTTEDGNEYSSIENAESDGYRELGDGRLIYNEDAIWCEEHDEYREYNVDCFDQCDCANCRECPNCTLEFEEEAA